MVPQVEEIGPELEFMRLAQVEALLNGEVPVLLERTAE